VGCEVSCETGCESGGESGYDPEKYYCLNETLHYESDCSDEPALVNEECWLGSDMPPETGFTCWDDMGIYRRYHLMYGPVEDCPQGGVGDACEDA
jgi:hypothetical protein